MIAGGRTLDGCGPDGYYYFAVYTGPKTEKQAFEKANEAVGPANVLERDSIRVERSEGIFGDTVVTLSAKYRDKFFPAIRFVKIARLFGEDSYDVQVNKNVYSDSPLWADVNRFESWLPMRGVLACVDDEEKYMAAYGELFGLGNPLRRVFERWGGFGLRE